MKVTMSLSDEDYRLARAHAADRGLKVSQLARQLLKAEIKRHAARTGLLAEIERIVTERMAGLTPRGETQSEGIQRGGAE